MNKKALQKFKILIYMLALTAGIIIFACGFCTRLPKDVVLNGVDVGRLTRAEAVAKVREETQNYLRTRTLEIEADGDIYTYTYPEINYRDNLPKTVEKIRKSGTYAADIGYYLCGMDEVASGICAAVSREKVEPYAEFKKSGAPFSYCDGNDGVKADYDKLVADIENSLEGGFGRVTLSVKKIARDKNLNDVKKGTAFLSRFTTYFDGDNYNRSGNIALAAASVNGMILEGGKTFSFNGTVGERTPSRGYRMAKIIENGKFVEGVGGGVCQVSTTLYNAALLAGMNVTEFHPHSLAVGYVPPSRDAMVSGKAFDLKFQNPFKTPVYIRAETGKDSVKISFYGTDCGAKYSLETQVTGVIPAPVTTTDDPGRVSEGKDGLTSEGYLVINRGGFIKRVLLRKDKYLPVASSRLSGASVEDSGADESARLHLPEISLNMGLKQKFKSIRCGFSRLNNCLLNPVML